MTVKKININNKTKSIFESNTKSDRVESKDIKKVDTRFEPISKEECNRLLVELSDEYDEAMRELAK